MNETKNEIVSRNECNRINFILANRKEEKIEIKWKLFHSAQQQMKIKKKQLLWMNKTEQIILNETGAALDENAFHSFTVAKEIFLWQLP